jgi:hypothetical protein
VNETEGPVRTTWLDRLAQRVALRSTPTEEAKPAPPLQGKGAGAAPGRRTLSRREALGMAVGASAAFASLDWWLSEVPASAATCDQSLAACISKANHDGVFAVGKNMVLCVAGFSGLKAVLPKLLGPEFGVLVCLANTLYDADSDFAHCREQYHACQSQPPPPPTSTSVPATTVPCPANSTYCPALPGCLADVFICCPPPVLYCSKGEVCCPDKCSYPGGC